MDPSEWLERAQSLPLGGKAIVEHDCGSGRKLLIEHKPEGWGAWCYRCSEPGWVSKPKPSLSERIAALSAKAAVTREARASLKPPMPAVFDTADWPQQAKVWLYQAGLDKDWLESIGFYWCPRLGRIVMPVLSDQGSLIFWQARGFAKGEAKYLSPALPASMSKPVYKAAPVRALPNRDEKILCLTEDILSANKVGQAVTGWSILGTSLTPSSEAQIVNFGASRVLVWLDNDEAGINGRRKIVPQLRALGIEAKAIRASRDPKCYPLGEIQAMLL